MKNEKVSSMGGLVDKSWRWFISLKLTFVMLTFIGVGAVIGMSFDQTVTFEEFFADLADQGISSSLLEFFEAYDAFHSWWFSLAILLLAANLIACSIERLPRIFFDHIRPRPYLTKRRLLGLSLKKKIVAPSLADAQKVVESFLPKKITRARLPKLFESYFYERQRFGRFGVYVVHISLLIVMFSSIYTTQRGVDGHVLIEEGKSSRFITARGPSGVSYMYDLGFYIGCDDFRLRTFVDNSPMEFESDLFISDKQKNRVDQKTVRVNEPLSHAGFTFYQSSFRPIISEKVVEIEVSDGEDFKERYRIKLNSPITLPNSDVLRVEKIYEDFAGLGQALRVGIRKPGKESTFFHVFRRYKDFDKVVRAQRYSVVFLESDQQYATGLSVGKVPGISIIFFGFLMLTIGLYLCFFTLPIRYFARIVKGENGYTVWLAASGFRNPKVVQEDFVKRVQLAYSRLEERPITHP